MQPFNCVQERPSSNAEKKDNKEEGICEEFDKLPPIIFYNKINSYWKDADWKDKHHHIVDSWYYKEVVQLFPLIFDNCLGDSLPYNGLRIIF